MAADGGHGDAQLQLGRGHAAAIGHGLKDPQQAQVAWSAGALLAIAPRWWYNVSVFGSVQPYAATASTTGIVRNVQALTVSMAGELRDLTGISRGLDLRLKPFVVGGGRRIQTTALNKVDDAIHDIGLDARYGLTAGLNMDVTINTDFAQVEVDEQQVNLTRFGLFYPEKRDFFLENSNFFTMGTGTAFTTTPVQTDLFFSRRIGLSDSGTPIPITAGVRVAGKSGRNNVGTLDIQTEDAFGVPGANFFVGRYSRDVFKRSRVGAIFINKDNIDDPTGHFNRTMGVDANLAPSSNGSGGYDATASDPIGRQVAISLRKSF